jgi:hypothetical protein
MIENEQSEKNGHTETDLNAVEQYLPAMEFGRNLATFAHESAPIPKKLVARMNDAFSLICYTNPMESSKAYLFDQSQRLLVAKALNAAILEHVGKENSSALDDLFKRAHFSRERAMNANAAGAVFVTAGKVCAVDAFPFQAVGSALNANQ